MGFFSTPWASYLLYRVISLAGSAISAVLQSASAALASIFDDPSLMQGVMSGQGAIGFAVAITQFFAALRADKTEEADHSNDTSDKLVRSTATFFVISFLFTVFAFFSALVLVRLPMYKHTVHLAQDADEAHRTQTSLAAVHRKIQHLGSAMAFVFIVTIGLFPGITSSIQSTSRDSPLSSVSLRNHSHSIRLPSIRIGRR